PPRLARRGFHGAGGGGDAEQPAGDHGAVYPPAGGLALRRPAPVGGGRQGGDVELQGRPPRRAHRGPGRGPDPDGPRPGAPPSRPWPGRDGDLPQPQRRLRGRRPDRRPPPRQDGGRGAGGRLRPPERDRVHDHRGLERPAPGAAGSRRRQRECLKPWLGERTTPSPAPGRPPPSRSSTSPRPPRAPPSPRSPRRSSPSPSVSICAPGGSASAAATAASSPSS